MTVAQLVEEAKQLTSEERRILIEALAEAPREEASRSAKARNARRSFLALAGKGESEHRDVSTDKYKHLGEIYS